MKTIRFRLCAGAAIRISLGISLCLGVGMAMAVLAGPVSAQVIYRVEPYFDPYGSAPVRPFIRQRPLSPGHIADILIEDYRFRRVGRPRFTGDSYIVDGVDRAGRPVRAEVDAFDGRIIALERQRAAPERTRPPAPGAERRPDNTRPRQREANPPPGPPRQQRSAPKSPAPAQPSPAPAPAPSPAPSPAPPTSAPSTGAQGGVLAPAPLDDSPPRSAPVTPPVPAAPLL